jgi:hypothetical protein
MEQIGPGFGVFLLMNNYFHDVSTVLLAASGLVLMVMTKRYRAALLNTANSADQTGQANTDSTNNSSIKEYFAQVHKGMVVIARFSLLWILVGAIPRTLFYRDFEWANAVEHGQVIALILKHVLAFLFVGIGAWLWKKVQEELKEIAETS